MERGVIYSVNVNKFCLSALQSLQGERLGGWHHICQRFLYSRVARRSLAFVFWVVASTERGPSGHESEARRFEAIRCARCAAPVESSHGSCDVIWP